MKKELNFSGTKILICEKNCKKLDEFGNDLCRRRTYVGHAAPPDRFITGISKESLKLLKERDSWTSSGYSNFKRFEFCEPDGGNGYNIFLTPEEAGAIPSKEINDESYFICPKRRHWAERSKIQKAVIVEYDSQTVLVDHFGVVLNLEGEEIPLKIDVPLPGDPGSEKVIYHPTSVGSFKGEQYFYRNEKKAPQCLLDAEKHLFRPSPTTELAIGESEIMILQTPVNSSDCGHQSDIKILRAGDKIAKYTPGKNRHLLKPGEKISLPESFLGSNGWYTKKYTFENRGGKLEKYLTEGRNFALKQAEILQKDFGLEKDDAWKIIKVAGPGAAVEAAKYGKTLLEDGLPHDFLMTALNHAGPGKTWMGRERAEKVLKAMGVNPPDAKGSNYFFRILQGARKYVHIN